MMSCLLSTLLQQRSQSKHRAEISIISNRSYRWCWGSKLRRKNDESKKRGNDNDLKRWLKRIRFDENKNYLLCNINERKEVMCSKSKRSCKEWIKWMLTKSTLRQVKRMKWQSRVSLTKDSDLKSHRSRLNIHQSNNHPLFNFNHLSNQCLISMITYQINLLRFSRSFSNSKRSLKSRTNSSLNRTNEKKKNFYVENEN